MQTIQDIIDTETTTGFSWHYGLEDDQGYLRRMLRGAPTLEAIYARLRDDIEFVSNVDEDYFRTPGQFKAFKKIKKYLQEAKKYIKEQIKKTKKGSKWENEQINKELRQLDRDARDGLIDPDDYDYAYKMLLRPATPDLEEVKSKFEEIDRKAKQELAKYGYEEESLSFEESCEKVDELLSENIVRDIKIKAKEFLTRLTGKEDWSLSAKTWGNPFGGPDKVTVTVKNFPYKEYGMYMRELKNLANKAGFRFSFGGDVYSYDSRTGEEEEAWFTESAPNIDKSIDEDNRRYTMGEFNDIYEEMNTPTQQADVLQKQKLTQQYATKNAAEIKRTHNQNIAYLKKMGVNVRPEDAKNPLKVQQLVDGLTQQN